MKRIAPSLNISLGEPKWFEVPDSRVTSYTSVIEKSVAGLTPDKNAPHWPCIANALPRRTARLFGGKHVGKIGKMTFPCVYDC